jgi:DnaJ-class molecular chaperone
MKELYSILGLQQPSSLSDIKKQYRKLALQYHPDKVSSDNKYEAEQRFKEIAEAWSILQDPTSKKNYDEKGFSGLEREDAKKTYDSKEVFESFFADMNPFVSMDFNYSHDFKSRSKKEVSTVKDQHNDLPCSLFDICNGAEKLVRVTRKRFMKSKCLEESTILAIHIKQGAAFGETIKFEKEGDQERDQVAADLIFTIRKDPQDIFERIGDDLVYIHRLTLLEALTECFIQVPTVKQQKISIALSEVVHPTYERTIFGEGLPMLGNPERVGNLLIRFQIVFPKKLSRETKQATRILLG